MKVSIHQKAEKKIHAENENLRHEADSPLPISSTSVFSTNTDF